MALLKEDNQFTHVIAIDFGTGASGYSPLHSALPLLPSSPTSRENCASRCSIPATVAMTRRPPQPFCFQRREISWNSG